jgi:hypothetical protein
MFSTTQSLTAIIKLLNKIMKNLLFGIIATVLFSFNGNAQEKIDFDQKSEFKSATIKVKSPDEATSYSFKTLNEFNEGAQNLFDQLNFDDVSNKVDRCEVTIEVTVAVTVGSATITMSGSVTTTCGNAVAAAKKLKSMLIAAAMS